MDCIQILVTVVISILSYRIYLWAEFKLLMRKAKYTREQENQLKRQAELEIAEFVKSQGGDSYLNNFVKLCVSSQNEMCIPMGHADVFKRNMCGPKCKGCY